MASATVTRIGVDVIQHVPGDRPAGCLITVPSGITGQALSYFTPDPLPDLLSRYLQGPAPATHCSTPFGELLLLRAASRSNDGRIDLAQARRFLSIMRRCQADNVPDLIDLGQSLSPRVAGIRKEIVFVGGRVAGSARHIYSPHSELPRLLNSLELGLKHLRGSAADPMVASAVVGMFCSYMHPFVDANGRWSRLVAFSAGKTGAAAWAWRSMAAVAFMNSCKSLLSNKIWPDARLDGARTYLSLVEQYEARLFKRFGEVGAFKALELLAGRLLSEPVSSAKKLHVLAGAIITGRLPIAAVQSCFGLSHRAAAGRLRLAAEHIDGISINKHDVDLSVFAKQIDDVLYNEHAAIH